MWQYKPSGSPFGVLINCCSRQRCRMSLSRSRPSTRPNNLLINSFGVRTDWNFSAWTRLRLCNVKQSTDFYRKLIKSCIFVKYAYLTFQWIPGIKELSTLVSCFTRCFAQFYKITFQNRMTFAWTWTSKKIASFLCYPIHNKFNFYKRSICKHIP